MLTLKALGIKKGDEVIVPSNTFIATALAVTYVGATPVFVEPDIRTFNIDPSLIEEKITENTKAIIVNSPNNPTGAVLTIDTIKKLAKLLEDKQKEYGKDIYIISDEPYRELVYGEVEVPFLTNEYNNTIVCYSFSKSLSLPGERIGYILVSPKANEWKNVFFAVCGAGRALGFVCAPALFQYMVPECLGLTSDLSVYDTNRTLLYNALTEYGYRAIRPDGAFYLFVETPEKDAVAFCEKAKKYELLLVPSNDFGCGGFVRISYCVTTEQIKRSLPAFKALAEEYGLIK
jgi:aspartate aminotransferase